MMAIEIENRKKLENLVLGFTEAFNNEDLNEVMSYFGEGAIYEEFNGIRNEGLAEIRNAFKPQFSGAFGKMRFYTEDMFVDVRAGKAMIRWVLTLEEERRAGAYRGLDLLYFCDNKLVEKHTYCKAKVPFIQNKTQMLEENKWPI
ncbi:MAG: hypothetical protein CMM75_04430 [Rhodospirillaceae bacterium]|nr:hypothetical protein [Rhodospirillaceae bacterium]|tara:strand:- start:1203 stop:1637 length:435 start_codon:yes stop_codon:yes gene_type:complete